MHKVFLIAGVASTLGACATASFAPPGVDRFNRMTRPVADACASLQPAATRTIERTVNGALDLMDNFSLAYGCAAGDLGNGRRYFEVPAFLLGVAGLVGPSFGMGPDGRLLAGTGAAVLGYGNNYFSPKVKAATIGSAHRAVACMQTESVGIAAFKNKQEETKKEVKETIQLLQEQEQRQAQRQSAGMTTRTGMTSIVAAQQDMAILYSQMVANEAQAQMNGAVSIDAEVQYYQMILGSLEIVHSILTERLRTAGTVDAASIFKDLKTLAKEHEEAKKALAAAQKGGGAPAGIRTFAERAEAERQLVTLQIDELRPRIEMCVLQARL